MINKILHQVWLGPKEAPEEWMQTWKNKHPDWLFMRWGTTKGIYKNNKEFKNDENNDK